ncbi:MAG: hypothetical protein PVF21_05430 [Thiohalophilus sp.]|jgi:DNA polymerase-4
MPDRSLSPSASSAVPKPWSRAILLVDMNAFFASIEQLDFPELRGNRWP